jgi:2-polyprenyl-6-methoxyphenol hydroxylase-like FAD-dependent oxidoreductase
MTIPASLSLDAAAIRLWDVLIVGAGPAGALTAREVARRGVSVLLVDRAMFPRWKVCGACLNGRALATLQSVGLGSLTAECRAIALENVKLAARDRRATLPLPGGVAVSREAFDASLVRAAIAMGAAFLPETYATLVGGDETTRVLYLRQGKCEWSAAARILVAADGLGGKLLTGEPGFRILSLRNSRIGAGVVAPEGPAFYESGSIFMACGAEGYVGVVRLEDGRLDVAAAFDRRAVRRLGGPALAATRMLAQVGWPAVPLLEQMNWRGTPALTRHVSRVAGHRLFVVGDSAGYVEPFTGEGMAWALEAAVALAPLAAEASTHWTPRLAWRWRSAYRHAVGTRRACRAATRVLRHPMLTRSMIALLGRYPVLGEPVIRHLNRYPPKKAAHS